MIILKHSFLVLLILWNLIYSNQSLGRLYNVYKYRNCTDTHMPVYLWPYTYVCLQHIPVPGCLCLYFWNIKPQKHCQCYSSLTLAPSKRQTERLRKASKTSFEFQRTTISEHFTVLLSNPTLLHLVCLLHKLTDRKKIAAIFISCCQYCSALLFARN